MGRFNCNTYSNLIDDWWRTNCKNAYCDKNNILRGAKAGSLTTKHTVPWKDSTASNKDSIGNGPTSWRYVLQKNSRLDTLFPRMFGVGYFGLETRILIKKIQPIFDTQNFD